MSLMSSFPVLYFLYPALIPPTILVCYNPLYKPPSPYPQYPVENKVYHLSQQYLTIQDSLIYSEPTPPPSHIHTYAPRTTLNHWLRPDGRSPGFRSTRIQEEGSRTDSPVSSGQHGESWYLEISWIYKPGRKPFRDQFTPILHHILLSVNILLVFNHGL